MRRLFPAVAALLVSTQVHAAIIYSQNPIDSGGALQQSSYNGNDWDRILWDNFTLSTPATITAIHWRGGYDPQIAFAGYSYPVIDFDISIWQSLQTALGTIWDQPDFTRPQVKNWGLIGDNNGTTFNAGETYVGNFGSSNFGSTPMYDYTFVLPQPVQLQANTEYWLKIAAYQAGIPSWGFAYGGGGDNRYFYGQINYAGGMGYHIGSSFDAAFTLEGAALPEPGALSVLGVAALGLLSRRRRAKA